MNVSNAARQNAFIDLYSLMLVKPSSQKVTSIVLEAAEQATTSLSMQSFERYLRCRFFGK